MMQKNWLIWVLSCAFGCSGTDFVFTEDMHCLTAVQGTPVLNESATVVVDTALASIDKAIELTLHELGYRFSRKDARTGYYQSLPVDVPSVVEFWQRHSSVDILSSCQRLRRSIKVMVSQEGNGFSIALASCLYTYQQQRSHYLTHSFYDMNNSYNQVPMVRGETIGGNNAWVYLMAEPELSNEILECIASLAKELELAQPVGP